MLAASDAAKRQLQTSITVTGVVFTNGAGSSGAAVYGERSLTFERCSFVENESSVHGGAIMGGRMLRVQGCEFRGNSAKFAGAVRINDIGSAQIEDSLFIGNSASGRGGAICTQIEKPDAQRVEVKNTLFCFNESPMSPHIYNYRTATHKCTKWCDPPRSRPSQPHSAPAPTAAVAPQRVQLGQVLLRPRPRRADGRRPPRLLPHPRVRQGPHSRLRVRRRMERRALREPRPFVRRTRRTVALG